MSIEIRNFSIHQGANEAKGEIFVDGEFFAPFSYGGISQLGIATRDEFRKWAMASARTQVESLQAKAALETARQAFLGAIADLSGESFLVPERPKLLTVSQPMPNAVATIGDTIIVRGQTDSGATTIQVNGEDVTNSVTRNGGFVASVLIKAETNAIRVQASNEIGDVLTTTIPLLIQKKPIA